LLKVADLIYPTSFGAPTGVTPLEIRRNLVSRIFLLILQNLKTSHHWLRWVDSVKGRKSHFPLTKPVAINIRSKWCM